VNSAIQSHFIGISKHSVIIRLTALWALNESALGGILHLVKMPFMGIFLGGFAIILISLIAYFSDKPFKDILKSLVLVLIVKLLISPHSPPTAYLAVSFQALYGALVYSCIKNFKLATFLFASIGLVESAVQKLITLTLIFGMSIWDSIDVFVRHVLKIFRILDEPQNVEGSYWIVGFYLGVYVIVGIMIGIFAGNLPAQILEAQKRLVVPRETESITTAKPKKKRSIFQNKILKSILLFSVIIGAAYYLIPNSSALINPLWVLARVVLLLLIWFFVVGPFFVKLLRKFLKKKEGEYKREVEEALGLLPIFKSLVMTAWKETSGIKGLGRIKEFIVRSICYTLLYTQF